MASPSHNRTARVASLIREELADLILREVKDPGVAGVSLTDVDVTGDLREARVYFFVTGDEKVRRAAERGLARAAGFLRRELGRRIRLRTTPELKFFHDASLDYGAHIDEKLRELGLGEDPGAAPEGPSEDDDGGT